MQYTDYINQHHAQKEREQQLVNQYNQKTVHNRSRHLWTANSVSKHSAHKIDVIETVIGCIIVAIILVASLFLN